MPTSNARVAALLCQERNGTLCIATHVPAKSDMTTDYSQTTLTAHLDNEQPMTAMQKAVASQLNVRRGQISLQLIPGAVRSSNGKTYIWLIVFLPPNAVVREDSKRIQQLVWNTARMLPASVQAMNEGRRRMFVDALTVSCERGWLRQSFPRQILDELKNLVTASA